MPESLAEYERRVAELDALRDANLRLQQQLRDAKARTDRLVEAAHIAARDAMLAVGPIVPIERRTPDKRTKNAEVALWHLTDWQLGKITPSYNSATAQARVMEYCRKADRLTEIQRADHPVNNAVIMFGGDMVEGVSFQFPQQPFEIDSTLFEQYVVASRLMVDVVRYALGVYQKVTVVGEWGNHGRIGSKRDVVPRNDNIDRMAYHLAREILVGETRLTWDDCPEDIQRIQIGNYRALLIHGDEIGRSGFASPNTIVAHVARWQSGAYNWTFQDCYGGHYHNHSSWSLPNGKGSFYQTGSVESENRYARDTMAAAAEPSQRLHFVDPNRGRVTAEYKVFIRDHEQ